MTDTSTHPTEPSRPVHTVLVAGATGFVGKRLLHELARAGFAVVGTSRHPEEARGAFPAVEFRRMDVTDAASTVEAMKGCDAAVYLVHSMADGKDYADVEATSATAFRDAATQAHLSRVVYLGGIRPRGSVSRHLKSRLHTGEILRSGTVPTIELQATMIIGGGGESWRMVRDLAARLPFMLLPRWLDSESQPVAVDDVVHAIAHCLGPEMSQMTSHVYTLPGPETLAAREILRRTARLLGSDPRMLRVPFVTPRLSSYWIRLVTRADRHVAVELVEGLRSDIVSTDDGFWRLVPDYRRSSFDEAARRALGEEERGLSFGARMTERFLRSFPGSRKTGRPAPSGS
ncbi:MAG TPA: NAD(P)H-binding protein [Polyangiaceae bacterium]|nr:NAD(P)H-binding protein [Polyangiaceae bacterium]